MRRDGEFVRAGFRADLDEARTLRDDSRKVMAGLEARNYAAAVGIKSLKVRHNNILGFYIEVPAGAAKPMLSEPLAQHLPPPPDHGGRRSLHHRRADRDRKPHRCRGRSRAGHRAGGVRRARRGDRRPATALGELAAALAELDCEAGLAEIAAEQGYMRPILDDSTAFEIRGGRHPVVEQALQAANAGAFIENDCVLAPRAKRCRPALTK